MRTWAVFQDQPDQRLGHDNLVQAGDVRVDELAVVVDLAGEVRVVFVGGLEHDLDGVSHRRPSDECVKRTLEPLVSLWVAR